MYEKCTLKICIFYEYFSALFCLFQLSAGLPLFSEIQINKIQLKGTNMERFGAVLVVLFLVFHLGHRNIPHLIPDTRYFSSQKKTARLTARFSILYCGQRTDNNFQKLRMHQVYIAPMRTFSIPFEILWYFCCGLGTDLFSIGHCFLDRIKD